VAVGVGVPVGFGVGVTPLQLVVTMNRSHPPAKLPESPAASSTTYRLQVPLALVPLKVENAVAPDATGAGAGKVSPVPELFGP
jgi:hypothetical protein